MAPILHIMRHGQGYHSVTENGHSLRDPLLTPEGEEQCRERCRKFQRHDNIDLLLASPMRRALQTCQLSFAPCLTRGLPIIALPLAEEGSSETSDTGSDIDVLRREFATSVDFAHVPTGWYEHVGAFATDAAALKARAVKLRRWIRDRPEREAVLVCHGYFNHFLTGDVNEKGEQTTGDWAETELRTFEFEEGDDAARICETAKSLRLRGATGGE